MKKFVVMLLVLFLLLGVGLSMVFLPRESTATVDAPGVRVAQVDTSKYPEVTLYVGVEDGSGQTRGGLGQGDFVVTEDGTPVDVTAFQGAGSTMVSTLLLMDCSGSMSEDGKLEGAQEAAERYVDLMRPGDQTAVVSFCNGSRVLQSFTNDHERLDRAINRLDADGPTPLYDGLVHGIDLLAQQQGRRALILLSDGRDCYTRPCEENPGSSATIDQVIARAQGAGLDVQVIGLGDSGDNDFDEHTLQLLAEQTGGNYFHAPSADELAQLYAQLGGSLHEEYALTYVSPRPFYDGTRRDIAVTVDGASSASGYVEEHLINVHSSNLVGVLLLIPLVGALAAPSVLRRRRNALPAPTTAAMPTSTLTPALAATGATVVQAPASQRVAQPAVGSTIVQAPSTRTCISCGATLRDRSRFCNKCGSEQPIAITQPERRVFCDQCGRPLLAGARFCMECGATSPVDSRGDGR